MDIFPYNDGEKDRFGDPMRIERLLDTTAGGSFAKLLQLALSENPDISNPATDRELLCIQTAFEIKPFDPLTGQGTTEEFQFNLYDEFLRWRDKKKANGDSPPSLPTPTVGTPPAPPVSPPPSKAKLNTASGLTSHV